MAYGGTQTVTTEKQRVIKISTAALDADAEVGAAVDSDDRMPCKLPTHYGLVVTRTAGATALISVSLQGSLDNTNWTSIITVTAKDTQAGQSLGFAAAAPLAGWLQPGRPHHRDHGAGRAGGALGWT